MSDSTNNIEPARAFEDRLRTYDHMTWRQETEQATRLLQEQLDKIKPQELGLGSNPTASEVTRAEGKALWVKNPNLVERQMNAKLGRELSAWGHKQLEVGMKGLPPLPEGKRGVQAIADGIFADSMNGFVRNTHMNPRLLAHRPLRELLNEQVEQLVHNEGITPEQAVRKRLASIGMKPAVIEEFAPVFSKAITEDIQYGAALRALEEKHWPITSAPTKAAAAQLTQEAEQVLGKNGTTSAAATEAKAAEGAAARAATNEASWLTRTLGKNAGVKAGAIGVGAAVLIGGGLYVANEMKRREKKTHAVDERGA